MLTGVFYLICVQANDNGNVDTIKVPLGTESFLANPGRFDNYVFFDRTFGLDQRIGNPYQTAGYTTFTCNPDGNHSNYAVAGWTFHNGHTGKFAGLQLECLPIPN